MTLFLYFSDINRDEKIQPKLRNTVFVQAETDVFRRRHRGHDVICRGRRLLQRRRRLSQNVAPDAVENVAEAAVVVVQNVTPDAVENVATDVDDVVRVEVASKLVRNSAAKLQIRSDVEQRKAFMNEKRRKIVSR